MNKNHGNALLLLIISLAIFIRLIPFFILKEPFSTDAWPLIRETNILINNVRIWNNSALGGYNNRIPGVMLFSEVISVSTGISPFYIYSLFSSFIIGESMLLFYIFIKRLGGNGLLSISFVFFFGSFLIFTSSLLKEVFAYPFFFLILFLAYFAKKAKDLIMIIISSATLVITHPLPTVFLISTLALIPILRISKRYLTNNKLYGNNKFLLATSLILTIFFAMYYFLYGLYGVKGYITSSIRPTLFIYASLITLTYVFFMPKKPKELNSLVYLLITLFGIIILFIATLGNLTILSNNYYSWQILLIGLPLLFLIPVGFEYELVKAKNHLIGSSLFLVFATSILYIIISEPVLQIISYRLINYLIIWGGIVLGLVGNREKIKAFSYSASLLSIIIGVIVIIVMSTNLIYGLHWYLSSQWRYSYGFVNSAMTTYKLNGSLQLYGDVKFSYLLSNLANVKVNSVLTGNIHGLLVLNREDFNLGYYTTINVFKLNELPINLNSDLVLRSPYIYVIYYR